MSSVVGVFAVNSPHWTIEGFGRSTEQLVVDHVAGDQAAS